MLKHDQLEEQAAKVRVTPEELAAAISRIEARKDADQRQADGTIPIGEAVQQLGLEATSEEVLAEVEAARAQQVAQKKRPSRRRLALLSSVGLGVLGLVGWWSVPHATQDQALPSVTLSAPQDAPRRISLDPNLLVGDASGKLVMLSEVGDDQPVHCCYFNGRFYPFSPENNTGLWELIKHDGKVYVRGRVLKMSPKVFLSDGADVTTIDNDPAFATPVTLPLKGFDVLPGVGSYVAFHAVNIHLDKHAYEKWKP